MFNTGLFILEVQKRPCLWNVKDSAHRDRQAKLRAWKQIAKTFNTSNDSFSNKNITIDVLQRKWKHLRDYYIRERKRTSKLDSSVESNGGNGESSTTRKRNSPLLEMLKFLDLNRGTDIVEVTIERNVGEENFYPENDDEEEKSISEHEDSSLRPIKIQRIERHQSNLNSAAEDNEDSADKQFLASLLPIIKNMTTKEKFKFRAQLMNPKPQECQIPCNDTEESRMLEIRKKERLKRKSEEMENFNKETKCIETTLKRDEFCIYGEYVANKLRNIQNKNARLTAEFHINGILYKAEMGEYDNASRDATNTSRTTNSKESSNARSIEPFMYEDDDSEDIIATVIKSEVLN